MRLITLTHSIGLAATLLVTASLQAQTNRRGEAFPQQNLPRHGRSQEIPALLGQKLDQVAAWYDRSAADLVKLCAQEKTLRSDKQGRLHLSARGCFLSKTPS
jgi:hypothetical protein